tara:strand:+ start:2604 stop:2738 length:135 start_codon:yes stop_codon:yes gene_type:complete
MKRKINISDYMAQFLKKNQIKFVFEMSGGMMDPKKDDKYVKPKY